MSILVVVVVVVDIMNTLAKIVRVILFLRTLGISIRNERSILEEAYTFAW